jgi:hypothetical protein
MTAHVVHELPVLVDARGRMYSARVLGALAEDGSWDGAIEFLDQEGHTYETGTETHQPSLTELIYWSTALTHTNVQRALARAKAAKASRPTQSAPRGARSRRPTTRRSTSGEKQSSTRTRRASGVHARPR